MTTRDDLEDGGAGYVAAAVRLISQGGAGRKVEVLTSDFQNNAVAADEVLRAGVSVFGHNVETVPSLYEKVRPGASYRRSLTLLERVAARGIITKSALMVGLGETEEEIRMVMRDLLNAGVTILVIGQYLRPSHQQVPVTKYWEEEAFSSWEKEAKELGFKAAACGPFVRSSYRAAALFRSASLH